MQAGRVMWQQCRDSKEEAARARARVRREIDLRSPLDRTALHDPAYRYHDELDASTGRVYAVSADYTERREILADAYGDGRHYRPWASKKSASRALAAVFFRLGDQAEACGDAKGAAEWRKRAMATASCGDSLIFNVHYGDDGDDGDEMRLKSAHFCHDPLCQMCLWRRSIRNTAELTATVDRIISGESGTAVRFLFLTLTVPNCAPEDARRAIDEMHAAFGRMTQAPWWKARFLGYTRKTEWTWSKNPAMTETPFNSHMHVMLAVPATYFERPEQWRVNLHCLFRDINYNARKSAGQCHTFERAVCSVRGAVAHGILADMARDGVTLDNGPLWRTKYRQRYQRLIAHIDALDAALRPLRGVNLDIERWQVRRFAAAVADAADVAWMDQTDWLMRWRDAMRDQSIMDVHITAVKHHNGEPVREYDSAGMKKAIKEVCKYTQKSADYLLPADPRESERRVFILRDQLTGLRMLSYGGIMAEVRAAVLADWKAARGDTADSADSELIHTSGEGSGIEADERLLARWSQEIRAYTVTRVPDSDAAWARHEAERQMLLPEWDRLSETLQNDVERQVAIFADKRASDSYVWQTDDHGYPVAAFDSGYRIGGAVWAANIGLVHRRHMVA